MKKTFLLIVSTLSLSLYAQKSTPGIQAIFVSATVNAGINHTFSEVTFKRDLVFTINENGVLNGEIMIWNTKETDMIFKGTIKDEYLIDSAMWYERNKLIKVVHFREKCCTNHKDYVDPTPKKSFSIKGEKHGIERIYNPSNPEVIKEINNYQYGKRHYRQYEFDSVQTLINVRTYKAGQLHDTSWINCHHKVSDIEVYTNDVPTGIWKKYDEMGMLAEAKHRFQDFDSTVFYLPDGKISTILFKSSSDDGLRSCREYDGSLTLRKQYFVKERWDNGKELFEGLYLEWDAQGKKAKVANYKFGKLMGAYEEYENGIIHLKGEYMLDEQVETWFTYNSKGKVIKTEFIKNREDVLITQEETGAVITEVAVDVFPHTINKPTISMQLTPNGKIAKLFKIAPEINWVLKVKTPTDYQVICEDERLSDKDRKDLISYLTSCIHSVKGTRYNHKEVPFSINYQLVYK